MLIYFGYGTLLIALAASIVSIVAAYMGIHKNSLAWTKSARNAMLVVFPLLSIASFCLIILLITNRFEVLYVYNVVSRSMPLYLKVAAVWGGQAGSLLFWAWTLSAFTSAVMLRKWERDREFLPWVIIVTGITLIFFISMVIFVENPFRRIWLDLSGNEVIAMFPPQGATLLTPSDGYGLNPLLRHPGMIIHPPALYLGFAAFVIPYAFAIAALVTNRTDDRWIRVTRRWTLVAWLFLSLGLVLGSRWAYDVLGWGGYWAWDPVENSALMPWLTGTAFLHSVMIQEKRGLFKRWNMVLIILTYSLVIFGTFLTRSGVFSSVHAFAESAVGPLFFGFIAITLVASLALLLYRWQDLAAEGQMSSLLSREALFLLNNLLFIGIFAVTFWGVVFPLISELLTGQKITVGPPFYERATAPLFGGLIFLMGIAPLSAWGHSTVKTLGRTAWKPFVVSLVILGAIYLAGMRNWIGLLGFWLISFSLLVTLYEYLRGAAARSRSTGEKFAVSLWKIGGRNRRRYGGYIVHIGLLLMGVGILGIELFQKETQNTISLGETMVLDEYQVTFQSISVFDTDDGRNVARAVLQVAEDGQVVAELYPRQDYYYDSQQQVTVPGVLSSLKNDLYVLLVEWQVVSGQQATFKIYLNPLINWLWIGSLVFMLGAIMAAWPARMMPGSQGRSKRG
ncbi:MAG: heme lyase CcmF/NrfE family subunit [Chloroflexi bacterium]|nr:heme lyase CcmF/NrfE family subunit [Chloroflexota bacterium]